MPPAHFRKLPARFEFLRQLFSTLEYPKIRQFLIMPKRGADDSLIVVDNEDELRYFLNPGAVSEHLYCSICQEVFSEPQRAPCGHSFCRKCILPWLKQSKTCPEDRKPLQRSQLHHDFILENIIGDQQVACPFRKSGCRFVGQLALLAGHKKNCTFNPVNLPEFIRKDSMDESLLASTLSDGEEALPTPGKPSLKMRLYAASENKRKLLCSMFNDNSNKPSS